MPTRMSDDTPSVHYCPESGLYWTDDQIDREMPASGRGEAGTEPISVRPVHPIPFEELTGVDSHTTAADLRPMLNQMAKRPSGLFVALEDRHPEQRYCWGLRLYDRQRASLRLLGGDAEPVHTLGPWGMEELREGLASYYAGYIGALRRALETELVHASPDQLSDLFQEVVLTDPWWAVEIVEHGVSTPAGIRSLKEHLYPRDVKGLLGEVDPEIRERVLRALPQVGRRR